MFRKKEKAGDKYSQYLLTLYDADMKIIYNDSIDRMVLPEDMIIASSEEIFNDPDPCEIHRWAMARWLYDEMIAELPQGRITPLTALSGRFGLCCREYNPSFAFLNTTPERSTCS